MKEIVSVVIAGVGMLLAYAVGSDFSSIQEAAEPHSANARGTDDGIL